MAAKGACKRTVSWSVNWKHLHETGVTGGVPSGKSGAFWRDTWSSLETLLRRGGGPVCGQCCPHMRHVAIEMQRCVHGKDGTVEEIVWRFMWERTVEVISTTLIKTQVNSLCVCCMDRSGSALIETSFLSPLTSGDTSTLILDTSFWSPTLWASVLAVSRAKDKSCDL